MRFLRIVGWVFVALLLLIGGVVVGLATQPGRAILASVIESVASSDDLTISIGEISGWPPFAFSVDEVTVADKRGVFAEVDDLAVDVNMVALLTGAIDVNSLEAARIAVERLPEMPPSEDESGSGGLMPLAVDLLSIDRFEMGAELAGQAAAFSLDGSVKLTGAGAISAKVDAERLDGPAGSLKADVERTDSSAPIALDLSLREAPNGLLLALLGRPVGPGYDLTANSTLSGAGLDGSVSLTSDGDARFAGRVQLISGEGGDRLILDGEGDLAELVPVDMEDLLAGTITVSIDAEWKAIAGAALPAITIHQGDIATGTVSVSAVGALTEGATDLSLDISAAKPDGGAISLPAGESPVLLDSLALKGTVKPADGGQRIDLVGHLAGLRASGIAVPGLGLSLAAEADEGFLVDQSLPFAMRIEADEIDTRAGRIVATDSQPLLVTAEGTFDREDLSSTLEVALSAIGGEADYRGTVSASAVDGEAEARFADLAPLSVLVGRDIAGALTATATGAFFGPDGIDLALKGSATDLDPGEEMAAGLLKGTTDFQLDLADDPSGRIAVSDLNVDGDGINLAGDFTLDGDIVDADLTAAIKDISVLAQDSAGAVSIRAEATGPLTRPEFDVTLAIADGLLVGQAIERANLHLDGGPRDDDGWQADLSLDGAFAGQPLGGTAEIVLDGESGLFVLPKVDLAIAQNTLNGSIEQVDGQLFSGDLKLDAPNISALAALGLLEAQGQASAQITLRADGGRQGITAALSANNVAVQSVSIRNAEGDVRIEDAFGALQVAGSLDAAGIDAGSVVLDEVRGMASVDGEVTRFEASASGPEMNVATAGSLSPVSGGQELRLTALSGSAFNFPLEIGAPVQVTLGETISIDNLILAVGGGQVSARGTISPTLDAQLTISGVAASVADNFSPGLGATGTISGRAMATGTPESPKVDWDVALSSFTVAQIAGSGLPAMAIAAKGQATLAATTVSATVSGGGISLNAEGSVPFDGSDLNLQVKGSAPMEVAGVFIDRELDLGGTATVDLTIAGIESISGTVGLANVTVIDVDTSFGVTDVAGTVRLAGTTATIPEIRGRMAQGGTITVTGSVTIDPAAGIPANLRIAVSEGRYADGSMIDANYTASVELTGPLMTTGQITGRVELGRTQILLPDSFGGGPPITVEHINVEPGFVPPIKPVPQQPAADTTQGGGSLGLDVTVQTQSRSSIIVRGFGLDAELGGSLRVTGTLDNMITVGGFEMTRGRIEVLGRRFDFTRGVMTFEGDFVPVLDFEASTQAGDITATVDVTGPADDPEISFSSVPELPEEEIISQILFNRNVGSLSALQAVQLVDAVAQFSGAFARGDGLFARVRNLTGVDDLDIRTNDSGGTTVGVGKRINDNLRLGVEQDSGGAARVIIDLDITRNIKARAEAGDDGSEKFGLNFEYEY